MRERRGGLRLGELGRQSRHLRLVEITQPVEIVGFRPRQHVMSISQCRQIPDLVMLLTHVIVEPTDGRFDREIGHVLAVLLGAYQKIGGVGVEPRHGVAGIVPHPEAAVGALQLDDMPNRAIERLRCRGTWVGAPQSRDFIDIKQGQGPARRLLETAIGVPLERAQEARNVPIGARTDAEQGFRRTRQEFVRRSVVERDAFPRLQPPDKAAQLIGLRRPHADREIACNLQIAWPDEVEPQRRITGRRRGQDKAVVETAAGGELHRAGRRRGKLRGAAGRQGQVIVSGRAFEVVDRDSDPRGIAGGEKPRQ